MMMRIGYLDITQRYQNIILCEISRPQLSGVDHIECFAVRNARMAPPSFAASCLRKCNICENISKRNSPAELHSAALKLAGKIEDWL